MAYLDPYRDLRERFDPAEAPPGVMIEGNLHAFPPLRTRVIASAIDYLTYRLILLGLLLLVLSRGMRSDTTLTDVLVVIGLPALVATLLFFGPMTWRGGGQSVGKRLMGLRVVGPYGTPLTVTAAVIREMPWRAGPLLVLAPVPFFSGLGDLLLLVIGVAAVHGARTNVGHRTFYDRLAGTVVVEHESHAFKQRRAERTGAPPGV